TPRLLALVLRPLLLLLSFLLRPAGALRGLLLLHQRAPLREEHRLLLSSQVRALYVGELALKGLPFGVVHRQILVDAPRDHLAGLPRALTARVDHLLRRRPVDTEAPLVRIRESGLTCSCSVEGPLHLRLMSPLNGHLGHALPHLGTGRRQRIRPLPRLVLAGGVLLEVRGFHLRFVDVVLAVPDPVDPLDVGTRASRCAVRDRAPPAV